MKVGVCAIVLASVLAWGCAEPTPDPVMSGTLTLDRAEAPLGSPIEMVYSFSLFDSVPAFDRDYRVLAHFLDADDQVMWTDDHDPPTPTTAWRPGQTITYARTLFLPLYPYVGEASISVGLYATDDSARVPMMGEDVGQRAYRMGTLQLLPQSENVFSIHQSGWHDPETLSADPSVGWRWTEQEAILAFRNPNDNVVFYLEAAGRPDLLDGAQTVTLSIGDVVIEAFTLVSQSRELRQIPIAVEQFGTSEMVELKIAVDGTFVPAERSAANAGDTRTLGLRVFEAFVDARQ